MNLSTFLISVAWALSVVLFPVIAILENSGWPCGIAAVGTVCMLGTSMPLIKEFCRGKMPEALSDVYRDVLFDLSMCSSTVLLSIRVMSDPDNTDALVYLSALSAVSIAVTRSCAQTLPAPVGEADLVELRVLEQPLSSGEVG